MSIYVSSVHEHGEMWRYYRRIGYPITSSWIDLEGVLEGEEIGCKYWPIWLLEARNADYLIFYAAQYDRNHNHCLLEIGACLAGGGKVLHVGVSSAMKTLDGELADFTYNPNWTRLTQLDEALKIAHPT